MSKWKRWIPLLIIACLMLVAYFSGITKALDYETLRYHHNELIEIVNSHPIAGPLLFMGVYAFIAAISLPGGLLLSLLSGYLFKQPWSTLYVLIGATTGATLLFLAAKTGIGNYFKEKAGARLQKVEAGFNKNAGSYLLCFRLVPFSPFWLVNLTSGFFNVPLRTFIWTTFVGIAPGAFVATQAGRGLNVIFESYNEFPLSSIFNTQMKIALICLAMFALTPMLAKRWKEKRGLSK